MPGDCRVQIAIPQDDGSTRIEEIAGVGDYDSDGQSAELLAVSGGARSSRDDRPILSDLLNRLERVSPEALSRVAVEVPPAHDGDPGHYRMLDIEVVGFGNATGDETPPVELRTEPWNSLVFIIRSQGPPPASSEPPAADEPTA
jgi:hypothetical protein